MADKNKVLFGKLWDGTKVFIVDGPTVRNLHKIDFTEGGHSEVYDYVPKNEIWVERMADPQDESFNLVHEVVEYIVMKYGIIPDYDEAHDATNTIEDMARSILTGTKPTVQTGDRLPPHEKPPSMRKSGWER